MIDELIEEANKKKYTKEDFIKEKKDKLKMAYDMVDEAVKSIQENPDFLKSYFDIQSKFSLYTPRNALLVAFQEPDASQVKLYDEWIKMNAKFKNRFPKKILIIEPSKENKKYFNAKEVVDIKETNVKSNMSKISEKLILQALLTECPIEVKAIDSLKSGNICEWNDEDKVIYVCRGKDAPDILKALADEIAKINLYNNNQEIDENKADCISYMICKKYGVDVPISSTDKLVEKYSKMELKQIISDLDSMRSITEDLFTNLDKYINSNQRETKSQDMER